MRWRIYIILILIVIVVFFSVFLMKANLSYVPGIEESGTASIFDFLSKEDTEDKIEDLKERFLAARGYNDKEKDEEKVIIPFPLTEEDKEVLTAPTAVEAVGNKIKIVVMPGHEPDWGGAEYYNLLERDFNVELGNHLYDLLREDGAFEVIMARDEKSFHPELEKYFAEEWTSIGKFITKSKRKMTRKVALGEIKLVDGVPHGNLLGDPLTRLYGISKWSNENDIDIVIHVHFNDYGGHRYNLPGEYSGFSIYVPERQYSNGPLSITLARSVFESLREYYPQSNLPYESDGVIEDQKLIAIGTNNTLDGMSLLIEYGYIYEPQFQLREIRNDVLWQLAFQTYKGVLAFFDEDISSRYYFLRKIKQDLRYRDKNKDVLALQFILSKEGVLPPDGHGRHDCKLDGFFGSCTVKAVKEFQKKYGLLADGIVGSQTRKKLDELYLQLHQAIAGHDIVSAF